MIYPSLLIIIPVPNPGASRTGGKLPVVSSTWAVIFLVETNTVACKLPSTFCIFVANAELPNITNILTQTTNRHCWTPYLKVYLHYHVVQVYRVSSVQ